MRFSRIEIEHLLYSWVLVSIIVAFILDIGDFFLTVFVSAFTVGIGFLLHELGHKFVAQKYGCFAEYRADFSMLFFALVLAMVFQVVFIAPGAVFISGYVTRERNGKISLAGPLVNIVLSVIFLFFSFFSSGFFHTVVYYGAIINAFLALFNMIPVGNLDGAKVLAWSKPVYFSMAFASLMLYVFSL